MLGAWSSVWRCWDVVGPLRHRAQCKMGGGTVGGLPLGGTDVVPVGLLSFPERAGCYKRAGLVPPSSLFSYLAKWSFLLRVLLS